MKIESKVRYGASVEVPPVDVALIKNEPMLHRATPEFALANGKGLTRAFVEALASEWDLSEHVIIDSRSHMLMPKWYPAIPGFHHDDVPRTLDTKQPNYVNPEYRSEHCMMLVNAGVAPTEFALGTMDFDIPDPHRITYEVWHPQVVSAIAEGKLRSEDSPDCQLVFFDDRTWHQAVPAVKSGWRWFIRATRHTNLPARNEVRQQVQVYLENPMQGW